MTKSTGRNDNGGWYHGWNIVAICVLTGVAVQALPVNGFSLFLASWSHDLHVSFSTLTLGITEFALGTAIFSPLAGMIADRFAARIILACGVAGLAAFCIAISYVTEIWQYFALYAGLLPISILASTSIPQNKVVMRWFVRRRGLALGLIAAGASMAGVVMPPIVAALLPVLGWRMIWRLAGIILIVVILPLVLLIIRQQPASRHGQHYLTTDGAEDGQKEHGTAVDGSSSLRWKDILTRRNFWLLVAGYLLMLILYGGAGYNLPPIASYRGFSIQAGGFLLSAWSLAQMVASLGAGIASDKFGNRLLLALLAFLTAIGGVVLAFCPGFPLLLLGAALVGAGGGFWPLIASALAAEFGPANFGRAFGALMLFLPLGATPAFVVAKVKEITGSYVPSLLGLAILSVIGGICCLFLREKRGAQPPREAGLVENATIPLV
jgi:MFS family permease